MTENPAFGFEVVPHCTEPDAIQATAYPIGYLGGQLIERGGRWFVVTETEAKARFLHFAVVAQGYVKAALTQPAPEGV